MSERIKRTERGWIGHYICADHCRFRRNTLLEFGDVRVVVSSVGMYWDKSRNEYVTVGPGRYYETMAFYAKFDGRFWDADVGRQVTLNGEWCVEELDGEDRANDMHDARVREVMRRIRSGELNNG